MAWYSIFVRSKAEPEERALTIPFDKGGVYEPTESNALRLVPVYAAVAWLADSVSSLPIHAYRTVGDERQRVSDPSLIRDPNPRELFGRWIHKAMVSLLLHGNAYGFVLERDGFGYPTQLEWLDPNIVTLDNEVYRVNGRAVPRVDIIHIKWMTLPGSNVGYSPMDAARFTIDTGTASMKYGANLFESGGVPSGTFVNNDKSLTAQEANETAERLRQAIKRGRPLVHGKDWTFNPIAIPPAQAEFIATSKMTANQIAAIYRVPSVLIGGDPGGALTYNSPEQDTNSFLVHSLRPWLVLLEEAISALLPNSVYVKFGVDSMIRVDTLARMQAFKIQREIGLRNVDELRALEDLPPLPDGQGQSYEPISSSPPPAAPEPGEEPHAPAD